MVENIFVKESSVGSDMTVMLNLEIIRSERLGWTPLSQVDKAMREVFSKTYWLPPKASYLCLSTDAQCLNNGRLTSLTQWSIF